MTNIQKSITNVINNGLTRTWWLLILILTMTSFLLIRISGFVGTQVLVPLFGWESGIAAVNEDEVNSIEGQFARWDSGYYLQIAQSGYRPDGTERGFFPLYPMFIRFVSSLSGLSFIWSGLLISIISFILACLILYKWVIIDYQQGIAQYTVLWACIFPMTFFCVAVYPEALFFLFSITSIYFARRGQFLLSGVMIALAGATRPTAFLLAIPFILEFYQQRDYSKPRLVKFGAGMMVAPIGVISYIFFLAMQLGNFDLLKNYSQLLSSEWDSYITWPWVTLYDGFNSAIFGVNINTDWFSRALVWQDLLFALFALSISIWALFRLRASVAVFLLLSTLFYFANHGPFGYAFWSLPRHISSIPPIYLALAILTVNLPRQFRWLPISFSIGLLLILTAWFVSGRWVA